MFWACPNILCRTKNYFIFSGNPKNFVLALKLNLLNTNHLLIWYKKFWISTNYFGTCRRTRQLCIPKLQFLCWHKNFWSGKKYNTICDLIYIYLAKNILTNTKVFRTCRRTRHKYLPLGVRGCPAHIGFFLE